MLATCAAQARDGRSVRRQLLDEELERLSPVMRGRVLEIGNGRRGRRGKFQPPIAESDRWVYLDLQTDRTPHVRADAQLLPFGSQSFDTLICLEMLEYVAMPSLAIQEMYRVLRCHGSLILSVPFVHHPDAVTDYWRFTAYGTANLLRSAGLEVTHVSEQGRTVAAMMDMLRTVPTPSLWPRRIVKWATSPVCAALLALDGRGDGQTAGLSGLTTGYVVVAKKTA
jgi:SAM-dependent methyltransferase